MDSALFSGFKTQLRVIHALLMREIITRYGRHNLGFLWLFIEPMIFAVGITILWTFMGMGKGTMPIAGFAITGYCALVLWRNMVNRLGGAVSGNLGLLHHRQVKVVDLLLARAILEIASCTVALIVLTLVFTGLDLMYLPVDPYTALLGWLLICWFVIGAGFIGAYLGVLSEVLDRVWHVFMYLTLPFTGALFMVSWLPPAAQEIVLWSPMVNGVEMLRQGYFGTGIDARYSIEYLLKANAITLFVGMLLIRLIKRKLSEGDQ
jgi:capsular polysaccharide transport system permease protein